MNNSRIGNLLNYNKSEKECLLKNHEINNSRLKAKTSPRETDLVIFLGHKKYVFQSRYLKSMLKEVMDGKISAKSALFSIKKHYLDDSGQTKKAQEALVDVFPEIEFFEDIIQNQENISIGQNSYSGFKYDFENYNGKDLFDEIVIDCLQCIANCDDDTEASAVQIIGLLEDRITDIRKLNTQQQARINDLIGSLLQDYKKSKLEDIFHYDTHLSTVGIYLAVTQDSYLALKYFLETEEGTYDLNFQDKTSGDNLLITAVCHKSEDCLEILINERKKHGKSVDMPINKNGETAFLLSAKLGFFNAFELLCKAGADTTKLTNSGMDWLYLALSSKDNSFIEKILQENEHLPDPLCSKVIQQSKGILEYASIFSCDDLVIKNLPKEKLQISQLIFKLHFLGLILSKASGSIGSVSRAVLSDYLKKYADLRQNAIAKNLKVVIENEGHWVNLTTHPKNNPIKEKCRCVNLMFNDLNRHTKAYIALDNNPNSNDEKFIIDCNGGAEPVKLESTTKITGFLTEKKKSIGKECSGVTVFKVVQLNEEDNSFKEKIKAAREKSHYIEKNLQLIFKKHVVEKRQATGNCTYFSPMLALSTLWGVIDLEQRGVSWEANSAYFQKLKAACAKQENYQAFESWLSKTVLKEAMEIYSKMDVEQFKEKYPQLYIEKIDILTRSLAQLIIDSKNQKDLAEIVALIPGNLFQAVFSRMYSHSDQKLPEPFLIYLAYNHSKKFSKILQIVSQEQVEKLLSIEDILGISLLDHISMDADLLGKFSNKAQAIIEKLLQEEVPTNLITFNLKKRKQSFGDSSITKKSKCELPFFNDFK